MASKKKKEKIPFSLDHGGLVKFLEQFQLVWVALKALYDGPVGHNAKTQDFIRRMESVTRHSGRLLDHGEHENSSYKRTIEILGVPLMNEIEEYVEEKVEVTRANSFYEDTLKQIGRLSPSVWDSKRMELGQKHALFNQIDRKGKLVEVVKAYNEMAQALCSALDEAKAVVKEREDRARREAEARENLAKMEKNRIRGHSILASLTA